MFGCDWSPAISDVATAPEARTSKSVGLALWTVVAVVFIVATLTYAFEAAVHFSGSAIDGPFQLLNGLRRIQGGFTPGVDFQYFHGLGIPYSHYWLYRLLGGGLRGSELARQLITAALYPVVFLAVFRAFTDSWTKAICLTVAALSISYALKMSQVIFAMNSMLGVRSALPTMLPAILYAVRSRRTRAGLAGLVLGTSLFVSTEQGLSVLVAYVLVSALFAMRSSDRRAAGLELVSAAAIGIGTLALLLFAVGGVSGLRGALRYNFRIVPMDQYWYFGAPPNVFVPSWGAGLQMVLATPSIAIALVGSVVAAVAYVRRAWRTTDDDRRRAIALAIMSVYALISCASLLGVFTPAYVQPCRRVLMIVALLELTSVFERTDARLGRATWLGVPRLLAASTGLLALFTFVTVSLLPVTLTVSLPHVIADHAFGDARFTVDGIWPSTLRDAQQAIDTHRGPNGQNPTLWSTYAGWIEARNGMFHPSFDYIIHALGVDNRREYTERFRTTRPTLVQTIRPTYTQYEAWLENYDWEFYDELLDWYAVSSMTPWSIFWERRTTRAPPSQLLGMMTVPAGLADVPFPPLQVSGTSVIEVEIEYQVHNPWRWLPIVGASPRFLIGIEGAASRMAVSLDPFVTRMRFPIVVTSGQRPVLHFQTASLLPGASWTATSLRVSQRPIDARQGPWLTELTAFLNSQPR